MITEKAIAGTPYTRKWRTKMIKDALNESVIATDTLIGTFDILGASAIYEVNDSSTAQSIVSFIVKAISDSINEPIQEMQRYYEKNEKKLPDESRLKELIERTSSYIYADTIVFICDVSEFDQIMMRFATEYFQVMAIEITRRMFILGLPIRGCLNYGTIARYKDQNKIVVSGKAYVDAIRIADKLEFSGTVITDELCKVIKASDKVIDYPPLQCSFDLPCVVKDKNSRQSITTSMWCLDWLDDTDFLKDRSDIRQLIFSSFAGHGKEVCGSVIDKINNTETIIRLLISHRNANSKGCSSNSIPN